MKSPRRFPAPWQVEQIPGGYKVLDVSDQALAYIYARDTKAQADTAKVLTFDEAHQIAVNVAKLLGLLGPTQTSLLPCSKLLQGQGSHLNDSLIGSTTAAL